MPRRMREAPQAEHSVSRRHTNLDWTIREDLVPTSTRRKSAPLGKLHPFPCRQIRLHHYSLIPRNHVNLVKWKAENMRSKAGQRVEDEGEVLAAQIRLEPSSQSAVQRHSAGQLRSEATNLRSLLNYVDTKWSDSASLADTDSTITLARIANPAPPKPKPSIYRHDYHIDLESTRSRQRINPAMDPGDSMLISKPGSPIIYDTQAEVAHGLDGGHRGSRTSVKYPVDRISTQQERRYQAGTGQRATSETQSSQHVSSSRDWSNPLEDLQVATGQAMHLIRARQQRIEALEAELSKRSAQAEAWKAQYIAQKKQNDERSSGAQ